MELEITYSCEYPECSHYAVIELNDDTNHGVHFIITPYTYTPSLQAVDAKYAEANAVVGSSQKMVFKGEKITLDIPLEGIVLESGWAITPLALPEVSLFRNTSQYVTVGVLIKVILP